MNNWVTTRYEYVFSAHMPYDPSNPSPGQPSQEVRIAASVQDPDLLESALNFLADAYASAGYNVEDLVRTTITEQRETFSNSTEQ